MLVIISGPEFQINEIEVGPAEPIYQIKQRIEMLLGIPVAKQTLTGGGSELLDGWDMTDYPDITDGSQIILSVPNDTPSQAGFNEFNAVSSDEYPDITDLTQTNYVRVNLLSGSITVEVDVLDTVGSLKEKIRTNGGPSTGRQTLSFADVELTEDGRLLSAYGITDQSEITVVKKSKHRSDDAFLMPEPKSDVLNILLEASPSLGSGTSLIQFKDSIPVKALKQQLINGSYLPFGDYFFVHKQRTLEEEASLSYHGVRNGDTITVYPGTITST